MSAKFPAQGFSGHAGTVRCGSLGPCRDESNCRCGDQASTVSTPRSLGQQASKAFRFNRLIREEELASCMRYSGPDRQKRSEPPIQFPHRLKEASCSES